MRDRHSEPLGVILAGGRGRRLGGAKATVMLAGRPLIAYPFETLSAVLSEVVILAKADTELPSLPGTTVWVEPDGRHHPLIGILNALELAEGRKVLVCAADLPFVTPNLLRLLARTDPGGSPAVVACARGEMQPLLGCYQPRAAKLLGDDFSSPLRDRVAAIGPRLLEVEEPQELFNVNAPEDLLRAAAMLGAASRT